MSALLEELRRSPALPRIVEDFRRQLEEEAVARRRFRDEVTEQQKAEFINGEVFMHSPATMRHTQIRGRLERLLACWVSHHKLGVILSEKSLVGLTRNDYEPDILFYGPAKAASLDADQLIFPPPDFVVEVLSPSTAHNDRGIKFEDYAAHGVQEYLLVAPRPQEIEQYVLQDGRFVLKAKLALNARYESTVVAGFGIPVAAVFDDEACNGAMLMLLGRPGDDSRP
jgi:Uma2 family endonuclease